MEIYKLHLDPCQFVSPADEVECYAPRFDAYNYECAVRPLTGLANALAALLKSGIY